MTSIVSIDINSDLGESYGAFRSAVDEQLYPLISSANVACGFHAGDALTMERTVNALAESGVAIGAHPSFPDLVGFGRREMSASPDEIRTDVLYQVAALQGFCHVAGVTLHHVKPHGALYNLASKDRATADAIVAALRSLVPDAVLYAQPGSQLEASGLASGLHVAREAFADRAYMQDGTLAPRNRPGAVLTDPRLVAQRVIQMIQGRSIPTLDGSSILVDAETVCIHSDTVTAVPIATELRRALTAAGIAIQTVAP